MADGDTLDPPLLLKFPDLGDRTFHSATELSNWAGAEGAFWSKLKELMGDKAPFSKHSIDLNELITIPRNVQAAAKQFSKDAATNPGQARAELNR